VPTEHGFRADDQYVPQRSWPKATDPDPQNPITTPESRTGVGPEGNLKLVTEDQIFEGEIAVRSKPKEQAADQQEEEFEHPAG
jgi:hypothetical protein